MQTGKQRDVKIVFPKRVMFENAGEQADCARKGAKELRAKNLFLLIFASHKYCNVHGCYANYYYGFEHFVFSEIINRENFESLGKYWSVDFASETMFVCLFVCLFLFSDSYNRQVIS